MIRIFTILSICLFIIASKFAYAFDHFLINFIFYSDKNCENQLISYSRWDHTCTPELNGQYSRFILSGYFFLYNSSTCGEKGDLYIYEDFNKGLDKSSKCSINLYNENESNANLSILQPGANSYKILVIRAPYPPSCIINGVNSIYFILTFIFGAIICAIIGISLAVIQERKLIASKILSNEETRTQFHPLQCLCMNAKI